MTLSKDERKIMGEVVDELTEFGGVIDSMYDEKEGKLWLKLDYPLDFWVVHSIHEILYWKHKRPFRWWFWGIRVETPSEYTGVWYNYNTEWARNDAAWRGHAWRKGVAALIFGYIKVFGDEIYKPENYDSYIDFVNHKEE